MLDENLIFAVIAAAEALEEPAIARFTTWWSRKDEIA